MSHEFDLAHATMLPPADAVVRGTPDVEVLVAQWEAVHEAAAAVADAKKEHDNRIDTEKKRLSEIEKKELESDANRVERSVQKIIQDSETEVKEIEAKFVEKTSEVVNKIKTSLS